MFFESDSDIMIVDNEAETTVTASLHPMEDLSPDSVDYELPEFYSTFPEYDSSSSCKV